jgi:Na+/melibiose symporter-like transporter
MAAKLKKSLLYTYGVGDLFFNLLAMMEVFYFTAFLTDYAKFSLVIVSAILFVTNAGDIICALWAGVILQKTSLKFGGKYRSWLVLGPPIVATFVILMFSKIGGEYIAATIIIFAFLASHLLWNVVFSATGALVGIITHDADERTMLSSSRAQGGAISALLFSITGPIMISFFSSRTGDIIGFTITTAIFGMLMILGYQYVYRITDVGGLPVKETAKTGNEAANNTLKEIIALVFKTLLLCCSLLLIYSGTFPFSCSIPLLFIISVML